MQLWWLIQRLEYRQYKIGCYHKFMIYDPKEREIQALSFADNSFDSVTETLLLCSVMDVSKSLMEIKRVLKPGGKFLWLEHVRPEESKLARAFDRVNWLWEKCTGGCNINRRAVEFVSHAGFQSCIEKTAGKGIFRYGICQKAQ